MSAPNTDPLISFFVRQAKKIKSLRKQLERIDDQLYDLQTQLEKLQQTHPYFQPKRNGPGSHLVEERKRLENEATLVAIAKRGARRFSLASQANGDAQFDIDGREIHLTGKPAALLLALAADFGPSDDEFVGWKRRAEAVEYVRKHADENFHASALTMLVHRLRQALWLQGNLHRNFIEVSPGRGLRFRLRRANERRDGTTEPPPDSA